MYKIDPQNPPKPCEYFDLIGGTSTGGLIAIMLGRLQMTIAECREAYLDISAKLFQPLKKHPAKARFSRPWKWSAQARFNTTALEDGMKSIVVKALRQRPGNAILSDKDLEKTLLWDHDSSCKVYGMSGGLKARAD